MARDRLVRIGKLIRTVLSEKVLAIARDEGLGVVSVIDVVVSADLSVAKIYVSVLGEEADRERVLGVLREHKGELRFAVGREVRLRRVPELLLISDDSMEKAARIISLIDGLRVVEGAGAGCAEGAGADDELQKEDEDGEACE